MKIENNILKHYLKNVYFITGTAYAGKSTTVKMLADRYDMVFCGENYHSNVSDVVAELISISQNRKVIVDTNIPIDILKEISDYNHVVVMLSPQSMSVERFFDRSDPEKQFLLNVIESCEDSEAVMENYRQGLALINSKKHYDEYANSGFFTVVRQDTEKDTKEEVCEIIAKHFGLS